ncbi:sodium:alanine symporter family protein [Bacillus tianshenii]|nr:sodium:alanine symporter family protein [Bacillus tianshenii]
MSLISSIEKINEILWGPIMLLLLLGTGVWYTFQLGFPQLTKLSTGFKEVFAPIFRSEGKQSESGISSFQALATSIAAQVGTGNLAGVATAIAAGGPGAIFWMWVSSFFGMATIFAEAVLAQVYREKRDGKWKGGPAYYIRNGLGNRFLAGFFAVSIILALGFIGNMVQSNSIAAAFDQAFSVPRWLIGIIVAMFVAFIIFGGIERIASFAEKVVPLMAVLYMGGSVVIAVLYADQLAAAFSLIVSAAFQTESVAGGVLGATIKEAIRYGVARGLFSNEAGMGSTPHAHAAADVSHPAKQGFVAMIAVFIDTVIICTLTALVILVTDAYQTDLTGIALTQEGFTRAFGSFGYPFIAICLLFFSFTTILGWAYFGENNAVYLFGERSLPLYRSIVLVFIVLGTLIEVPVVWQLADTFNALMVLPNLIALLLLSKVVKSVFREL